MTRPTDRDPLHESRFREILGVVPEAGREEIRRAYRRLVMENHPDRFPSLEKPFQDMRMIALNEAYAHLMTRIGVRPSGVRRKEGIVECAFGARGVEPAPGAGARASPPAAARNTIGRPKDPAYAYYKQGFLNYSLASGPTGSPRTSPTASSFWARPTGTSPASRTSSPTAYGTRTHA